MRILLVVLPSSFCFQAQGQRWNHQSKEQRRRRQKRSNLRLHLGSWVFISKHCQFCDTTRNISYEQSSEKAWSSLLRWESFTENRRRLAARLLQLLWKARRCFHCARQRRIQPTIRVHHVLKLPRKKSSDESSHDWWKVSRRWNSCQAQLKSDRHSKLHPLRHRGHPSASLKVQQNRRIREHLLHSHWISPPALLTVRKNRRNLQTKEKQKKLQAIRFDHLQRVPGSRQSHRRTGARCLRSNRRLQAIQRLKAE
jgi:hypothetical protein